MGGIENCFVSLPLPVIQTLESTRSGLGHLPQVLALELRSLKDHHLWRVAWSGATSNSSAIEVLLFISSPTPPCLCSTVFNYSVYYLFFQQLAFLVKLCAKGSSLCYLYLCSMENKGFPAIRGMHFLARSCFSSSSSCFQCAEGYYGHY